MIRNFQSAIRLQISKFDITMQTFEYLCQVKNSLDLSNLKWNTSIKRIFAWFVGSYLWFLKSSSDLGSSQRKSHVSGVGSSDGVHSKTTSLVGGGGKSSLGVNISDRNTRSSTHFDDNNNGHIVWSRQPGSENVDLRSVVVQIKHFTAVGEDWLNERQKEMEV